MPTPHAIVFDLDGTLIHSAPDIQLAANETLTRFDRASIDLPTAISFIGRGVDRFVASMIDHTGGADADQAHAIYDHFVRVYAQNGITLTKPYPGVITALDQLRRLNIPLGICTNKLTAPALDICADLGLSDYFDVIIGAEPDQPKKPEPQSLFAAIRALGGTPQTALYVGDSEVDYQTARNAAVPFRLFSGGYLNAPLPELQNADIFDDWATHGLV